MLHTAIIEKIDRLLLQEQKEKLFQYRMAHKQEMSSKELNTFDGILNLLDAITDSITEEEA